MNGVEVRIARHPQADNSEEYISKRLWRVHWPGGFTKRDG